MRRRSVLIAIAATAVLATLCVGVALTVHARRQQRFSDLCRSWRESSVEHRFDAIAEEFFFLNRHVKGMPRDKVIQYFGEPDAESEPLDGVTELTYRAPGVYGDGGWFGAYLDAQDRATGLWVDD